MTVWFEKNKNPTKTAPSPTGAKKCAYSKTVQLLYVFIVVKLLYIQLSNVILYSKSRCYLGVTQNACIDM